MMTSKSLLLVVFPGKASFGVVSTFIYDVTLGSCVEFFWSLVGDVV